MNGADAHGGVAPGVGGDIGDGAGVSLLRKTTSSAARGGAGMRKWDKADKVGPKLPSAPRIGKSQIFDA